MLRGLSHFNIFDFLQSRLGLDGVALYYELSYLWIRWRLSVSPIALFNFGYAPVSETVRADPLCTEPFRVELYEQVANAVGKDKLRGGRVLEISCGMGGGFDHLSRHCGLGYGVLLDRSSTALRLANRRFGLRGVRADAHNLPFVRESFDVVLNVEASHMFAFDRFLPGVASVLSPGGVLCIADYRHGAPHDVENMLGQSLAKAGLKKTAFHDVTDNIVESIKQQTAFMEANLSRIPSLVRGSVRQWIPVENSPQYNSFKARRQTYFLLVAQRL